MFLIALLISLFLTGCERPSTTQFNGNRMTIDYHITVGQTLNAADKSTLYSLISATFDEVDAVYNKWNPHSELSRINQLPGGMHTPLSPQLEKLLLLTDKMVVLTEGKFDPTIETIQGLWKEHLEQSLLPSPEQIALLSTAAGWHNIHFESGMFWKDDDRTALDLGGIAKGYCIDLLVERMNAAGYGNLLVEWGGEMRASGSHPDGRPWQVYIARLENTDPEQAIAHVALQNEAVATSGDYLQQWNIPSTNTTYFHIFDPRTSSPLISKQESICSATVTARTCTTADALATAAMMFTSVEEATKWAENLQKSFPEISFWFIQREALP